MWSTTPTTRSRQPFKYRSDINLGGDDDSDDEGYVLDETEQETFIADLASHSGRTDAQYVRAFTALPLLCTPAFMFFLARPASSPSVRFVCVLALTSLLASSVSMYLTPVDEEGNATSRAGVAAGVLRLPFDLGQIDSDGPLGRVVPLLNPVLASLLVIASVGMRRREMMKTAGGGGGGGGGGGPMGREMEGREVPDGFWLFCLLPPLMMVVVWYTKRSMGEVRAGIGELKGLKYGLKGA